MAPGGRSARPGPGMLGALGRPPGWRRGCRRPPRTWRIARSRRSATRRPHQAGPVRSRHGHLLRPGLQLPQRCAHLGDRATLDREDQAAAHDRPRSVSVPLCPPRPIGYRRADGEPGDGLPRCGGGIGPNRDHGRRPVPLSGVATIEPATANAGPHYRAPVKNTPPDARARRMTPVSSPESTGTLFQNRSDQACAA